MSDTTLYYSPAYTNGDTYTFDLSGVTFTSSDLGATYVGSPTQLTSVGLNKTNLVNAVIGNIVTSIGDSMFRSCGLLTTIIFSPPSQVISIGTSAFYQSGLRSIIIPSSITSIGNNAFQESALSTITFAPTSQLKSIEDSLFQSISSLTSIIIPDSVTNIGNSAFYRCYSLSNVTFNLTSELTSIGDYAFYSCRILTSITIPYLITSIGSNAFNDCIILSSVIIGNSVTSIGNSCFGRCLSLVSITIPDSLTSIGPQAFNTCTSLSSVTFGINSQLTNFPQQLFSNCSFLSSIIIPNSVTSIGDSAFYYCSSLSSVIIGNSVASILSEAFGVCSSLTTITIPNSVMSIGENAFVASALSTVTISDTNANLLNASWNSPTSNPPGISGFYGANTLAFLYPPPTITGVSPNSGNKDGGTPVTIIGTNFLETTSVTFGGVPATSFTIFSETQINCVEPPSPAGLINIVVTTSSGSVTSAFTNNIVCFKEGSKILTDKGYKLVQELRNGDLIKTVSSGFKKIEHIGYSKMYHNVNEVRSKDKLYRCPISEYPELIEDLVITGCHSILIDEYKDEKERKKTIEVIGNTYITDDKYRLPACVDDRTQIFEEEGVHTIWHFSLENSDYYMNYGVYANGLLVETTSNRMMVELSGMTLV